MRTDAYADHDLAELALRYIAQLYFLYRHGLSSRPYRACLMRRPGIRTSTLARRDDVRYACPNTPLPNESPSCYVQIGLEKRHRKLSDSHSH